VRNNPLKYVDPSGHADCDDRQNGCGDDTNKKIVLPPIGTPLFPNWGKPIIDTDKVLQNLTRIGDAVDKLFPDVGGGRISVAGTAIHVSLSIEIVYSSRSDEISVFVSPGVGTTAGTPSVEGGVIVAWNVKKNSAFRGGFWSVSTQHPAPYTTITSAETYFWTASSKSGPAQNDSPKDAAFNVTSPGGGVNASYNYSIEIWNSKSGLLPYESANAFVEDVAQDVRSAWYEFKGWVGAK
jgi:hypothetical protein